MEFRLRSAENAIWALEDAGACTIGPMEAPAKDGMPHETNMMDHRLHGVSCRVRVVLG